MEPEAPAETAPTEEPEASEPEAEPTAEPSVEPTVEPTEEPEVPEVEPTEEPTEAPTEEPLTACPTCGVLASRDPLFETNHTACDACGLRNCDPAHARKAHTACSGCGLRKCAEDFVTEEHMKCAGCREMLCASEIEHISCPGCHRYSCKEADQYDTYNHTLNDYGRYPCLDYPEEPEVEEPEEPVVMVTRIQLNKSSYDLDSDKSVALSATVSPNNATDKSVTWSSSNASVATVNANGVVTAVAPGNATITCKANDGSGVTATCTITVVELPNAELVTQEDFPIPKDSFSIDLAELYLKQKFGSEAALPDWAKDNGITLDKYAKFTAEHESVGDIPEAHKDWQADFEVTLSKPLDECDPKDAKMLLVGNYGTFGWIPLPACIELPANTPFRLIEAVFGPWTYENVIASVHEFQCGIVVHDKTDFAGMKVTVQLKVYDLTGNSYAIGDALEVQY